VQDDPLLAWTSMAGLNDPIARNAPLTSGTVTTIVGRMRWVVSIEFSLKNGRSVSLSGSWPAPTPTA